MDEKELRVDNAMSQEKEAEQYDDFVPVVDWRGFTEQDFENLQADRKYDPEYEFNREFYAGDLKLRIEDSVVSYQKKLINLYALDNGGTPDAKLHEFYQSVPLEMPEVKKMTYEEFQDKVESHLNELIKGERRMHPVEKAFLAENLDKPSPKNWAFAHLQDLTDLSEELIRYMGKTLEDIEKELVKPDNRKNVLLHGGSKNLMKKLKANLEKIPDVKKIWSKSEGR